MRYILEEKPSQDEYAVGIQDKEKQVPIPVTQGEIWGYNLQFHQATSDHFDFRLYDRKREIIYSWVIPKGMPEEPKEKRLAIRQPDHKPDYFNFEGEIESGYGKGKVKLEDHAESIYIIKSGPKSIRFAFMHQSYTTEFVLWKPPNNKDWYIRNSTPLYDELNLEKPKYKSSKIDELEEYFDEKYIMSPKIDGAHSVISFDKNLTRYYSPRKSKNHEEAIQYTFGFPWKIIKPIERLDGTELRAEVYFIENEILPPEKISGILNKKFEKAHKQLSNENIQIQFYIFDVEKYNNKDVSNKPFKEKLEIIEAICAINPEIFIYPELAITKEEKIRMINNMRSGKNPLTKEGAVIRDLDSPDKPIKLKFENEWDVYIREIEETIKDGQKMAGYFTYSDTPDGEILGKVGSGLTDDDRKSMLRHPQKWIGRVATIKGMSRTKTGSVRAPVFLYKRTDK